MAGFFKKGDAIAKFRELQEKYRGHDIVAVSGWESRPILLLLNQKLITEFILTENENCRKEDCYPMPIGPGFMATYGKKAMHFRGIINKCFHYDQLVNICPQIYKIVMKHVEQLLEDFESLEEEFPEGYSQDGATTPSDGFKCVSLRETLVEMLSESADVLLFGSSDYPKVNGLQIPAAIDELYTITSDHIEYSFLNFMTYGYLSYYKLTPTIRKAFKYGEQIKDAIANEYKKRCKKDLKDLGLNILDLMAKHDKESSPEDKQSILEVVENAVAVEQSFVGGARNVTESTLIQLATEPELQKAYLKQVVAKMDPEKFGEYQTYEKCTELSCFTKEVLRMYGSSGMLDDRDVVKEFGLGKYRFFKGTLVNVPFNAIQFDEKYYTNPYEFKIDRFSEQNKD